MGEGLWLAGIHRVHLCYWGQGRTLNISLICTVHCRHLNPAPKSDTPLANRVKMKPPVHPGVSAHSECRFVHTSLAESLREKNDRSLGRRRNFTASECKQLACLCLSKA